MKNICHKLREERGATILLALLLVLVAVMVSAVIISAALTATQRVTDDYSFEQSYQTVSSAASAVKDAIEASSVSHTADLNKNTSHTDYSWTFDGPFGEELEGVLKAADFPSICTNLAAFTEVSREYTVSAADFNDVKVTLTLFYDDEDSVGLFKLKLELTEDGGYGSSHKETVTLKMSPTPEDVTNNAGENKNIGGVDHNITVNKFTFKEN